MLTLSGAAGRLSRIPDIEIQLEAQLKQHTRFGIGGPADLLVDAPDEDSFAQVIQILRESDIPLVIIGGGSNLVVADGGFRGAVVRYTAARLSATGNMVTAEAGAVLQHLVDFTIDLGLSGIHTMTGIPGWVGGAVYGNAGAYGRSIDQSITKVRFFDGLAAREISNTDCKFRYRESIFKTNKHWVVFSTELCLDAADSVALRQKATGILDIRNAKYPPTMRCAGSIFKNLIFAELPPSVQQQVPPKLIQGGKVPSAFFLEAVGAKGIRNGDIHVADYHANLIYNAGHGTAQQVREVIFDLKARVTSRFGFALEEEVQYVGFQ
ncbi:MAG TPA: UDP-N-acetylmuramate dehydrogenase [Bryobacteraceae bacterium]|nr:UDP-N-acetylmuramate dehydrogenase [Bryobacteraceae bacterium]